MKKLLLILICLFVSFEVKSKEVILDCKGKSVIKEYGKIVKVNENENMFFYLNEREKYLGHISKDGRKNSRYAIFNNFYINLVKKYFRKNDEKFSVQIKKGQTDSKGNYCDLFDKDASDYDDCRLGSLYFGFSQESINLNRYNLNISHTAMRHGGASFSWVNAVKKKKSSHAEHAEYVFKNHTPGVIKEEVSFEGKCGISKKKI